MEVLARRSGALPAPLETLKVGKQIGRGGFAVVRQGVLKDAETQQTYPVAVKVLHPEYSDEACQELRLFKEEATLMLQLDHANIIRAFGLLRLPPQFPGVDNAQHAYALVLEMMEGGSLAGLMIKQLVAGHVAKYTFSQALGWVLDVARALQYLHAGGRDGFPRIHRDVKLENVLLTDGLRTAKLADFGLQRAVLSHHTPDQQQTILVRRSQRPPPPSASLPLPTLPATGRPMPLGPSRLAPAEAERPAGRASAPKAMSHGQLGSLGPDDPAIRSTGTDNATPTAAGTAGTARAGAGELPPTGASAPLFFAVEQEGLLPLTLPSRPPAVEAPDGGPGLGMGAVERLQEALQVARSAASMAALVRPGGEEAPGQRHSAAAVMLSGQQPGGAGMPPKGPAAPRSVSVSTRPPPGTAPRPSPLGGPSARAAAVPAVAVTSGSPAVLSPSSSLARNARDSPRGSGAGAVPAPPVLCTTVQPKAPSTAGDAGSRPGSAVLDTATGAAASGRAAAGTDSNMVLLDGRPSTVSAGEVLMLPLQDPAPLEGTRLPSPNGAASLAARPPSARRSAPATAAAAGGKAVNGTGVGSGLKGNSRLRLSTLTGGDGGSEDGGDGGDEGAQLVSPNGGAGADPTRQLLPGSAKHVGSREVSGEVRRYATETESNAPRPAGHVSEPGAAGSGGAMAIGGSGAGPRHAPPIGLATGSCTAPDSMIGQNSMPLSPVGMGMGLNHISSHADGVERGSSPSAVGGSGQPQQLADLLAMRLGALNVSVRSVRSTGNGMAPGARAVNGGGGAAGCGASSAPNSPRRAAVTAAARAAGGAPTALRHKVSDSFSVGGRQGSVSGVKKAKAAEFEEVFSLTGRTGSLIYLAPEAYKNEPYNDKVDVYSLAVLMYELFGRTSITYTHISTKLPAFSRMLCNPDEFAERVAAGYRPPRPNQMNKLPPELWELIETAWHQDPVQRPDIDSVVEALEALVEPLAEAGRRAAAGCAACIIS